MKKYKHIGKLALAASLLLPAAEAAAQGIHIYTKDGARHAYPLTGNPEEKLVIEPRDDDGAADKGVLQWLQADGHYGLMLRIVKGTVFETMLNPDPGDNGGCTVFALDDAAVNEYLATCPLVDAQGRPVRSVEQLTDAQKGRLASLLVHEGMHSFSQLTGEGVAAARNFLVNQVMTIDYFVSIKRADDLPAAPPAGYPDPWAELRAKAADGWYELPTSSVGMWLFTPRNVQQAGFTDGDVSFLTGGTVAEGVARLNNGSLTGGVRCKNGYVYRLERMPLESLPASEVLRREPRTQLAALLLSRLSTPVSKYSFNEGFGELENHNIYWPVHPSLPASPAAAAGSGSDMVAFFAPTDEVLADFFLNGQGRALVEAYVPEGTALTREHLAACLEAMPPAAVQPLVKAMIRPFTSSVPSKYAGILSDGGLPVYADVASEGEYRQKIAAVLPASNGVVYVMNDLGALKHGLTGVQTVMAAAGVSGAEVMRSVLSADDRYLEGKSYQSVLRRNYSATVNNPAQNFTLFVPSDDALGRYGLVDPMSTARRVASNHKFWRFAFDPSATQELSVYPDNTLMPVSSVAYRFTWADGLTGDDSAKPLTGANNKSAATDNMASGAGLIKKSLLVEVADQHLVPQALNAGQHYYVSLGGAPVYVSDPAAALAGGEFYVEGGLQQMMNADGYAGNDQTCRATANVGTPADPALGRGEQRVVVIDRAMQPAARSVYNYLRDNGDSFGSFFDLCSGSLSESDLKALGIITDATLAGDKAEIMEQHVLLSSRDVNPAQGEKLLNFLVANGYTLYVPDETAMAGAFAEGLPTWDDIHQFIAANADDAGALTEDVQMQGRAMLECLLRFVKYHFQEGLLFVDGVTQKGVHLTGAGSIVQSVQKPGDLTVVDGSGKMRRVQEPCNVMLREADFNQAVNNTATGIRRSTHVVLHAVNRALYFVALPDGRYDALWSTPEAARDFLGL